MNTPNAIIDSDLKVKESEKSAEQARADLKIPDPKPEVAKALLEGEPKNGKSEN